MRARCSATDCARQQMFSAQGLRLLSQPIYADANAMPAAPGERTLQSRTGRNEPDERTRAWIQTSLDNWETICRRYLPSASRRYPGDLYRETQAWHLAADQTLLPPATSDVSAVQRPRSAKAPARAARQYRASGSRAAYYPSAQGRRLMPSRCRMTRGRSPSSCSRCRRSSALWGETDTRIRRRCSSDWRDTSSHTRQLVDVDRGVSGRFGKSTMCPSASTTTSFRRATGRTRSTPPSLLWRGTVSFVQSWKTPISQASRRLLLEALSFARNCAVHRVLSPVPEPCTRELDDIFLVMEGVGEWVRFQLKRQQAPPRPRPGARRSMK